MKKFLFLIAKFEKRQDIWILIIFLSIFILFRIPSLVEPYWYGDEGIYEVIGQALNNGRLLYRDIWDNKPPLLYIYYAIFNGDQFSVRFLSMIFGLASIVAFFFLSSGLFSLRIAVLVSTFLFTVLFGIPILEGNIANAENFMILSTILAFIFIYPHKQKKNYHYILGGLLISISFLTKIVGIFDFFAILVFMIFVKFYESRSLLLFFKHFAWSFYKKNFIEFYKKELFFILSFISPIIFVSLFFVFNGAFYDYIQAVFFQNIGYVGYGNFFFFPLGFLGFKLFLVFLTLVVVFYYKERLSYCGLLIYVWIIFSLFNAFFSQRAYTHYLLVLLAPLSLLVGFIVDQVKMRIENIAVFLVILVIILNYFHPSQKAFSYYKNYFDFVFAEKSVVSYQSFFDRITPRDYRLADFISSFPSKKDSVFLWSDSGQIYALSNRLPIGRYIVAYHILYDNKGIEKLENQITDARPIYIITTKDTLPISKILQSYRLKYMIDSARIYERKN